MLCVKASSMDSGNQSRHVIFFTHPASHYVVMIAVAQELKKRGHNVSFLCASEAWDRIKIRLDAYDVSWIPISDSLSDKKGIVDSMIATPYSLLSLFGSAALAAKVYMNSMENYRSSLRFFQENPAQNPNIFVMEYLAGSMYELPVALGVPYVSLGAWAPSDAWLQPNLVPHTAIPSLSMLPPGDKRSWAEGVIAYVTRAIRNTLIAAVTILINFQRLSAGLPLLGWPYEHLWRAPLIVATVASTQDALLRPANVVWVGSLESSDGVSIHSSTPADHNQTRAWLDARLSEGCPVVYVAMGSEIVLPRQHIIEFAGGLFGGNWSVLWSLRHGAEHIPEPHLRDGRRARVTGAVLQLQVLGHAAVRAFVSHGGINSVNEALSRGVPLVLVPFSADQPSNAAALAARGAAAVVPKSAISAAAIRAALQRVLFEPGFRAAAGWIQREFARAPGTALACDIIEAAAAGSPPTPVPWLGGGPLALGLDLLLLHGAITAAVFMCCSRCCRCRSRGHAKAKAA